MASNSFSRKVRDIYRDRVMDKVQCLNPVAFAESALGLNIKLFPAQRFILRVFYGLPLVENLQEPIVIKDIFNEVVLHTFYSEVDFFNFLYSQKRINLSYETYKNNLKTGVVINEALLICGRRASKTMLTSIIVCHTLYSLLLIPDPFEFYRLIRQDPIGIALVSNSLKSSDRTFKMIRSFLVTSKFFSNYIGDYTDEEFWLKTESYKDMEYNGVPLQFKGDILVSNYAAGASVRGAANKVFVLDEIAHFRDAGSKTKTEFLDAQVYEAIQPSIFGFTNPETGKSEGLGFIMSSPNGKQGVLWNFYNESFTRNNTLMVNVPSNWINVNLASDEIKRLHSRSEASFRQEFLAEFTDSQSNWITDINRMWACFNKAQENKPLQQHDFICYAGFDLAFSNDRSVLAIGHYQKKRPELKYDEGFESYEELIAKDDKGYYIIDYVHIWEPSQFGDVNLEQLLGDLDYIFRCFKVKDGSFDQFSYSLFSQMIEKRPSIRMQMIPATAKFNSEKAMITKRLINEGRLIMPDIQLVRDEWSQLQETLLHNGLVRVANDVGHDDTFSAISTCLFHLFRNNGVLEQEVRVSTSNNAGNFYHRLNDVRKVSNNSTRNISLSSNGRVALR